MTDRAGSTSRDPSERDHLVFGDCRFDPGNRLLRRDGTEIPLAPRPLRLLEAFLQEPGTVLSRARLLETVWDGEAVEEDALTQAISVLRTALGDDPRQPRYVQTLHGRGYRFVVPVAQAGPGRKRDGIARPSPAWLLGFAAMLIMLLLAVWWRATGSEGSPADDAPRRYALALPQGMRPAEFNPGSVAMSPLGDAVATVAYGDSASQILVKGVEDFGLRAVPGTEHGYAPFFSPGGERLAYFDEAESTLVTVDLRSGGLRTLTSVADPPHRGTWTAAGAVFFTEGRRGLLRVPDTGGETTVVRTPDAATGETRFLDVQAAGPDRLLLSVGTRDMSSWNEARIVLLDLSTDSSRVLLEGGLSPRLIGDTLFFGRAGRLLAAELRSGGTVGHADPLFDRLSTFGLTGAAPFAVADNGDLAFLAGGERDVRTSVAVAKRGEPVERLPLPPNTYVSVAADHEGRRLALWTAGDFGQIWTYDLHRQTLTRQTDEGQNMAPIWRPGSDEIVYTSVHADGSELRLKSADDGSAGVPILSDPGRLLAGSWTPDGRRLAYARESAGDGRDIWLLEPESGNRQRLVAGRFDERAPAFSPDGKWLAYTSDQGGEHQVYLTRADADSLRLQVSTRGGSRPRWRADSSQILYTAEAAVMSVTLGGTTEEPELGRPEVVLDLEVLPSFDTLPGGALVVIEELPPPPVSELLLVVGGAARRPGG